MRVVQVFLVALAFIAVATAQYGPATRPTAPVATQPVGAPPQPNQQNNWNFRAWISNAFRRGPQGPETSCKYTDPVSGTVYDLTKLRKHVGDYNGADLRYKYALNFCGASNAPACAARHSSVCQFSMLSNAFVANLGAWSGNPGPQWAVTDANNPASGVTLTFANGDTCYANRGLLGGTPPGPRKTIVHLDCAATDDTSFTVNEIPNMCTFNIRLKSRAACGVSPGSAFFSFKTFCILLLLLSIVYVVAGCYYNVKYNEKQWGQLEAVPNYEFWLTVPGHVKTGATTTYEFVSARIAAMRNKDGSGDYAPVSASEESASAGAPDSAVDDDKGFEDL